MALVSIWMFVGLLVVKATLGKYVLGCVRLCVLCAWCVLCALYALVVLCVMLCVFLYDLVGVLNGFL